MCHSFSFHTVVLSPISGATLFRTPLLISLICLFQLTFYVLWLLPIFPLSSTLPHCILFVFHIAIAAVESPLIFKTKSQYRDKNTCCCRYVLIWFLLPLSFSGCSDSSFVFVFFTPYLVTKPFFASLLLILLHWIFISVSLSAPPLHWASLQLALFCRALSWQLFAAEDKTAFPFLTLSLQRYIS